MGPDDRAAHRRRPAGAGARSGRRVEPTTCGRRLVTALRLHAAALQCPQLVQREPVPVAGGGAGDPLAVAALPRRNRRPRDRGRAAERPDQAIAVLRRARLPGAAAPRRVAAADRMRVLSRHCKPTAGATSAMSGWSGTADPTSRRTSGSSPFRRPVAGSSCCAELRCTRPTPAPPMGMPEKTGASSG